MKRAASLQANTCNDLWIIATDINLHLGAIEQSRTNLERGPAPITSKPEMSQRSFTSFICKRTHDGMEGQIGKEDLTQKVEHSASGLDGPTCAAKGDPHVKWSDTAATHPRTWGKRSNNRQ
ncbi:Nucleoporin nup211 [Xyrichtys novacula]|uniref:Nucleoporin nup211 n=1 Tax=Xyrichtys novacula TaxID=13765 RepID=A0AAV1EPW7_XYRNO|nr:Nucleoporin nup211 [Xyrichtys novacula]